MSPGCPCAAAGMERFGVAVVQLQRRAASFRAEKLAEDEIDGGEHRRIAAEILVQVDATPGAVLPEAGVFGEENARVGLTEPVDALLDVPYEEAVLPVGNEGGDELLQVIRVLVFIHHDLLVFLLQRQRRLGADRVFRRAALVEEQESTRCSVSLNSSSPSFFFRCS